jgi:hypothetical protein
MGFPLPKNGGKKMNKNNIKHRNKTKENKYSLTNINKDKE